jgi:C1A family cysteine protease
MELEKHSYGRIKDKEDIRDIPYSPVKIARLPASANLMNFASPVRDQGPQGSCTGHGYASHIEAMQTMLHGKCVINSPAFQYYLARQLHGWHNEDSGAYVRDTFVVGKKHGIAEEEDFPYDANIFNIAPPPEAYVDAVKYKISTYFRVATLEDLKSALASGKTVVNGFTVFESFESLGTANTGDMVMPKSGERELGGHCTSVFGYQDDLLWAGGGFTINKNSWSPKWGWNGYFKMPYQYILDGHVQDMWTSNGFAQSDPIVNGCAQTKVGRIFRIIFGE